MAGALALFVLLAISQFVVRTAGVALRMTGVPRHIARFQAVSALTGSGFTTSEAESLMHHPTRRRILMILMVTGHLGIVSLASTVILSLASAGSNMGIIIQLLALILAASVIYALNQSETLDRVFCDIIGKIMIRRGWVTPSQEVVLYRHSSGLVVAEHIVPQDIVLDPKDLNLQILAHNEQSCDPASDAPLPLKIHDSLLCVGPQQAQDSLHTRLQTTNTQN